MEVEQHIDALVAAGEGMAGAADRAGPDAPVPTCPGWVVRDLVQHTGGVHRWATRYVRDAEREPIDPDLERLSGGWPSDGELVPWFLEGHAALVAALRAAPADLECFAFLRAPSPEGPSGPAPSGAKSGGTASLDLSRRLAGEDNRELSASPSLRMWARRQAHETFVHRVDAEGAAGSTATPPVDLALDGIDELLTAFAPRRRTGFVLDPARTLSVRPTDGDRRWDVEIGPERITTTVHPPAAEGPAPDATLGGPAASLYLWLWNRLGIDAVEVAGDQELLAAWTANVKVTWS